MPEGTARTSPSAKPFAFASTRNVPGATPRRNVPSSFEIVFEEKLRAPLKPRPNPPPSSSSIAMTTAPPTGLPSGSYTIPVIESPGGSLKLISVDSSTQVQFWLIGACSEWMARTSYEPLGMLAIRIA